MICLCICVRMNLWTYGWVVSIYVELNLVSNRPDPHSIIIATVHKRTLQDYALVYISPEKLEGNQDLLRRIKDTVRVFLWLCVAGMV